MPDSEAREQRRVAARRLWPKELRGIHGPLRFPGSSATDEYAVQVHSLLAEEFRRHGDENRPRRIVAAYLCAVHLLPHDAPRLITPVPTAMESRTGRDTCSASGRPWPVTLLRSRYNFALVSPSRVSHFQLCSPPPPPTPRRRAFSARHVRGMHGV